MVESIHAVIQEGSAAEEPSWALAPLGPNALLQPRCRDELSLWSVVGMQTDVSHRSYELTKSFATPTARSEEARLPISGDVFYALVCNVVACS